MIVDTKFISGKYKYPVKLEYKENRIWVFFGYNPELITQVKLLEGARYHGFDKDNPIKAWSVADSQGNAFRIERLEGKNPYAPYDLPLLEFRPSRQCLYEHQIEIVRHIITRQYCLVYGDPAVGKTLSAIEAMEYLCVNKGIRSWFYVAPKSALISVRAEFEQWRSIIQPQFFTYEALKSIVENWPTGNPPPQGVIFDESQKLKTQTAQRTIAAQHLADSIRKEHGSKGAVTLLSGSPAPKSPIDHYCLPKTTWIFTDEGARQVKDLVGRKCNIVLNEKIFPTDGFFYIGKKQLYEITTNRGYKIEATANHPFLVSYDNILRTWKRLDELQVGDDLVLNNHFQMDWDGEGNWGEGYLVGQIYGDGHISVQNKGYDLLKATIELYQNDWHLLPLICSLYPRQLNIYRQEKRITLSGGYLNKLIEKYNLDENKEVNNFIESASREFLSGFISAFFDCDGTVTSGKARYVIMLAQSNLPRLETVQRILLYFGIISTIRRRNNTKETIICGIKCKVSDQYEMYITKNNVQKFATKIGFKHEKKNQLLQEKLTLKRKKNEQESFTATITNIKPTTVEEVFDIIVPEAHAFAANGFIVHNSQVEVARPGYLLEGNIKAFQNRLAIILVQQSDSGQSFPKLESWRDDEKKCNVCGKYAEDQCHDTINSIEKWYHSFTPSINEVSNIYKRMKGLVVVKLKKECLDLPDKIFKEIICKPSQSTLNAAKLMVAQGHNSLQTMMFLRELSDGFQYEQEPIGTERCPICEGSKAVIDFEYVGPEKDQAKHQESGDSTYYTQTTKACNFCNGTGKSTKYQRTTVEVPCPKDEALINLLDEYEDWGRFVIYCGFTGSIERCVRTVLNQKWSYIRIDGKGWQSDLSGSADDLYKKFKDRNSDIPRLVIVAHPSSGGTGLNLQSACATCFYSNDTRGESRQQAIERIHRPGLDENRGATIYDLIHLPTDKLIIEQHNKKKHLQDLSLGQLKMCLESQ